MPFFLTCCKAVDNKVGVKYIIKLTVDEKEILYKLQAMRLSYFQSESIPRIDREYQEMFTNDIWDQKVNSNSLFGPI